MLTKLVLNNYKTFIQDTTFDFNATNYKFLEEENVTTDRVLKGALFVGENASGKTSVLKALHLLLKLLLGSEEINFDSYRSYFSKKDSFSLAYEFKIKGRLVRFDISFLNNTIHKEDLWIDSNLIVERMGKNGNFFWNQEEKNFNDISENISFLRRLYFDTKFYDDEVLNDLFKFLNNSIYINCSEARIFSKCGPDNVFFSKYFEKNGTSEINSFLKEMGYPSQIAYEEQTSGSGIFSDNNKSVSFKKNGTDVYIPIKYESLGNQTLINLLPSFLYSTKNSGMLIVDEFGSGFHNELEESLLKYFFHHANLSQIFVVSHSTNLLNNTILRPDQIYSISFLGSKGAFIKRFSDEMPRQGQNLEKMYISGVFDGKPEYKKTFKD